MDHVIVESVRLQGEEQAKANAQREQVVQIALSIEGAEELGLASDPGTCVGMHFSSICRYVHSLPPKLRIDSSFFCVMSPL